MYTPYTEAEPRTPALKRAAARRSNLRSCRQTASTLCSQGYPAHKKRQPPWDLHRALGIGIP